MIALPFIFFGILFIKSLRRNGMFNIGTYMLFLFTFISMMSIILDACDYYTRFCKNLSIDVFPALLYCVLLLICLAPYNFNRFPRISPFVSNKTGRILDYMTYFYFAIFCIILFVSLTRIEQVLASNSLAEIRNEHYTGTTESFYNHLSGLSRYICAICSILAPSGTIMTLILFYNLAFRNKKILFHIMTLLGSTSQLLIAINIADRSNFAYWILLIGLAVAIFYPYLSSKKKWGIAIMLSLLLILMVSYLAEVTVSRFGERTGGTSGGLVSYLGQSYINFCNFISYLKPADSLCEIFPFITALTGGEGYFDVAAKVESDHNLAVSVFSTFLGYIYSISGGFVLLIYVLFYNRISTYVMTRRRYLLELGDLIRIWAASLVIVLGLFCYYYSFMNCTIALIIWCVLSSIINPSYSLRKKHIAWAKEIRK